MKVWHGYSLQDDSNTKTNPRLTTIQKICDELHITLGQFFSDKDPAKIHRDCNERERNMEIIKMTKDFSEKEKREFIQLLRSVNKGEGNEEYEKFQQYLLENGYK